MTLQCMGGWCQQRDRCAHYLAPAKSGVAPVERLCDPGRDQPEPLRTAEHKARLASDPRFALWATMETKQC